MITQPNNHPLLSKDYQPDEMYFFINRLRLTAETRTWLDARLASDRLDLSRRSTPRQPRRRRETANVYLCQ